MSFLKIAVISDLHCKHRSAEKKGSISTILYSDDIGLSEKRHPVRSLYKLIEEKKLKVDIVICPGDITDKSDDQGLITGWSYLEKIKGVLGTDCLIATIGNHDVDSRNITADSAFDKLKGLDDKFPLPEKQQNDHYWLEGFSLVEYKDTLTLVFNSCYTHKNSTKAQKSKIAQPMIDKIEAALLGIDLTRFNYKILLCHHHPLNHANIDYEDTDVIDKGDLLLALVSKFGFQLCIHGHKHDPQLRVLGGLPIFCSGSFSSLMNVSDTKGDNTFHVINLKKGHNQGYIQTWIHLPKKGWITRDDSQFPSYVGFGYRGNIEDLAREIDEHLHSIGTPYITFTELTTKFQDLYFLSELDQQSLSNILQITYNSVFEPSYPNQPKILLKQVI